MSTYSSSDESGEEDQNEAPPPEPQPSSAPQVKTENGHTSHPNGKCRNKHSKHHHSSVVAKHNANVGVHQGSMMSLSLSIYIPGCYPPEEG